MAKDKKSNGKQTPQQEQQQSGALPLFYSDPQPLDKKKHTDLALKKNFGLGFTRDVNAVPINMVEMPQVCQFYPIAFSPDENATPVAILGVRDQENLFVDHEGKWLENAYIPAYIRRYPFIFSEIPGTDQLTLCIDLNDNVTEQGGEQKFFDKDENPTDLANNALEFCKSYHGAAQQTLEFSNALQESGLLMSYEAKIEAGQNQRIRYSGFRVIDEKKLAELDDKTFLEWRKKGWLPFLYAHLFSGAQWQRLTRLVNERLKKEAA